MFKRIKILSTTIALASVGISVATSTTLITNNLITNSKSVAINSTSKENSSNALVPAQSNGQNANISTKAGPVTFYNNTITALDWYGNKLWDVDMSTKVSEPKIIGNSGGYSGSWRRAWFNWDYNRQQNILWVLGYANNSKQTLFGIDASNGNFKYSKDLGLKNNSNPPYRFVTALSSGKVLLYGNPSIGYDAKGAIFDPNGEKLDQLSGNSATYVPNSDGDTSHAGKYRWYFYNLIPLTTNKNLVEVVAFDTKSGTSGDESSVRSTYNVFGILVDDELNFIGNQQGNSSNFKTAYKLADGIKDYRNTTITPQRDYFMLLNSQTVSVTYNTVSLFDTSDPNNIKISQVKMTDSKWIQTWTVDSNDNLYFKYLNDTSVYKIDGDTLKAGKTSFSPLTYLDLNGVQNTTIKQEAKNFIIYNVYDYTGKLMMIDASYNNSIDVYKNSINISSSSTNKNLGLAIGVIPNASNNSQGDLKGILNGDQSIQQVADFKIDDNILKSKIPSEITKDNLDLLNGAFFKSSDPKPVVISNIDDTNGTFTVTANLYKIPWFSNELPKDAVPNTVTYTFNSSSNKGIAQKISSKVSWKNLNSSTDYDFMNMLPSTVTNDDLKVLDPFQVSFQSQKIMDANGNQIYPKTEYSIKSCNDTTGKITIEAKYLYVPMNASYIDGNDKSYQMGDKSFIEKQVLTHTETHDYTIFNNSQQGQFMFMGGTTPSKDNDTQTVNVNTVPQLKDLLTAGTLPSSFDYLNNPNNSNNSSFLQFVDTTNSKGYPISKMTFNVASDDNAGTLTITANISSQYSPDKTNHTYVMKYTGLNQKSSYSFSFKNPKTIDGVDISNILPSSIDEGQIIKNFINYTGFDSNDFNVVLSPDDKTGSLGVQINLNRNYANTIGNQNGFSNYSINQNFSGFMTTDSYNSRFSISFKDDTDTSLLTLKSMQANEIATAFGAENVTGNTPTNSLTVGTQTYTSLNDFVQKLLVKSTGSSIPENWDASSGVTTKVYIDNNLGLASFYINIPKANVQGSSSDLNFVVTYTGFVKGNQVPTKDNLSFVPNNMLKNYLLSLNDKQFTSDNIDSLTADDFAKWAKDNITKLITYKTGEYEEKLKDPSKYTVTITSAPVQSTVTITINFGTMKDPNSLKEYSIQYSI